MPKNLVIVESPAKAKTIARYLGRDYQVLASVGHVRDLPQKQLGVDVEHGFRPTYELLPKKHDVVQEIREAGRAADTIYLATDPDREGEAIAWHVAVAARLDEDRLRRVSFHQITRAAVEEALANPRGLDVHLIDAQQARRVLDRLVGYQVSPLLSNAIRKGYATRRPLSAGRVQSVALRLVVDREREILAFVPEEYWTLDALLARRTPEREQFTARLHKVDGRDPDLHSRAEMDRVLADLEGATYTVTDVKKGQRQRRPQPPFITSTLQAEAGRKLRLSPRQTMRIAQQLYEGIDLAGERVGLITYMRTDSPQVAPEAVTEARAHIAERWGQEYLPAKPIVYKAKAALAQEAHEAIRPTAVEHTPEAIRPHLTAEQARLYDLIWRRFVASQMAPARYATMTVSVSAAERYLFRASGQQLLFPGYLVVYTEGKADGQADDEAQPLPNLVVGETLDLRELRPEQHYTQPPPRYTEPTLIKALEDNGVGRPSTYASIVGVIQDRGYVVKEQGRLAPTALGMLVCDALVATFADIMDVGYTAGMEERLDEVAGGRLAYRRMLGDFWQGFARELEAARGAMPGAVAEALWADVPAEVRARTCPECGKPLQARVSDAGRFLGCSGYPECRYTLDLSNPTEPVEKVDEFAPGETCPNCGGRMKIVTRGKGQFLGCEHYPTCKTTRPILSERIKALAEETPCPTCGRLPMEPRKGPYGEYLRCNTCEKNYSLRQLARGGAVAPEEVDLPCPACSHRPVEKRPGRWGPYYHCPACKANTSVKKMEAAAGAAPADSPSGEVEEPREAEAAAPTKPRRRRASKKQ